MAEHQDAYFLDRNFALEIASKKNRVSLGHPTIDGLQACYYDGEPLETSLPNLINVRLESLFEYFLFARTRLPTTFVASENTPDEVREIFIATIRKVVEHQNAASQAFRAAISSANPFDNFDGKLRIFLFSSRLTTVMQYASRNMAMAFEKLGHEVFLSIEENDIEQLYAHHHLEALAEFNPHLIFSVNHDDFFGASLSDDVFRVIWWQDLMPPLLSGRQLSVRKRDFHYVPTTEFDPYLRRCGITDLHRQSFCVDTEVFRSPVDGPVENKVVFVGSSYKGHLVDSSPNSQRALAVMEEAFRSGQTPDSDFCREIARRYNLGYEYVFMNILHYVVRDVSVEWLCESSPIPVEIYGPGWGGNVKVEPFWRGEVNHGKDLADVYGGAKYCLVCHPFEVNSQRLAEVAASRSTPIVYDSRSTSIEPHWSNELLFYKTKSELLDHLSSDRGHPVPHIATHYSYHLFAERICETVFSELSLAGDAPA